MNTTNSTEKKKTSKIVSEFITIPDETKNKYEVKLYEDGSIKVNKDDVEFEYIEDEDFLVIKYQGKRYVAEIIDHDQNKYTVNINGVSHSLMVETPISYKRRKLIESNTEESKNETVQAPMPGKIIEVLVETGQFVKAGEAVVILEAMKMQNEIQCLSGGKVTSIHVGKDDILNKDDLLVIIEKS